MTIKGLRVEAGGVRVADEQSWLLLKMEEGTPYQGMWGSLDTGKGKKYFFLLKCEEETQPCGWLNLAR